MTPICDNRLQKKVAHECANLKSMDPYSQHFYLNAQGALVNYFQFLRKHGATLSLDYDKN